MPRRQNEPTPHYKFRLLCKRCNSYMHTMIDVAPDDRLRIACKRCGEHATDIDEVFDQDEGAA